MVDLSKIKKGMPRVRFTKRRYFVFSRYSCDVQLELTLGQCRIGWCKLWNLWIIHLVFVDVIINYIRCKDKTTAQFVAQERKEYDK